MSFSQEKFVGKLQSLDETQDSIVQTSKWLLTMNKESDKIATAWYDYLTKSSISTRRKLLVIYLANDVVQQAKHKQVPNFDKAFGKVLPEALAKVYAGFPVDIRNKVKRVVGIWRQRKVLTEDVLDKIDAVLQTKNRPPKEETSTSTSKLENKASHVSALYEDLAKVEQNGSTLRIRFDKSMEALDPSSVVYAENFNVIRKIGSSVKESLNNSIHLRSTIIDELQSLLEEQKNIINKEQDSINEVDSLILNKDPSRIMESEVQNDVDLLPTYENSDDEDDDEDDDDNSSKSDPKIPRTEKRDREDDDTDGSGSSSNIANEDIKDEADLKRVKLEDKTASNLASTESPSKKDNGTIASSIQDLLSRLAD